MRGKHGHDLVAAVEADVVLRGVADVEGGVREFAREAAREGGSDGPPAAIRATALARQAS
jgi:hypothetical protein